MVSLKHYANLFLRQQLNRLKKHPLPNSLIYFVTSRCNSNCKGCFYWQDLNNVQQELTPDELEKMSPSLGKIGYLLISGGEPFLRNDFVELCEVLISQNGVRRVHLPTNGLLPDKVSKGARLLLEGNKDLVLNMTLSLDGFERTNDSLRCKGSFKKTLRSLSLLKELKKDFSNFSIAINTVVSSRNYDEIFDLAKLVNNESGVSEHRIFPIRGVLKTGDLKPVSSEDWLLLTQKLSGIKSGYLPKRVNHLRLRITLLAHERLKEVMVDALAGKKWPFKCRAGEVVGVLEPDGCVRLCELTRKVGNVRDFDYDFRKVWHSPAANALRKEIETGDCTRGCTHGCFLIPSLMYSPFNFLMVKRAHITKR